MSTFGTALVSARSQGVHLPRTQRFLSLELVSRTAHNIITKLSARQRNVSTTQDPSAFTPMLSPTVTLPALQQFKLSVSPKLALLLAGTGYYSAEDYAMGNSPFPEQLTTCPINCFQLVRQLLLAYLSVTVLSAALLEAVLVSHAVSLYGRCIDDEQKCNSLTWHHAYVL